MRVSQRQRSCPFFKFSRYDEGIIRIYSQKELSVTIQSVGCSTRNQTQSEFPLVAQVGIIHSGLDVVARLPFPPALSTHPPTHRAAIQSSKTGYVKKFICPLIHTVIADLNLKFAKCFAHSSISQCSLVEIDIHTLAACALT